LPRFEFVLRIVKVIVKVIKAFHNSPRFQRHLRFTKTAAQAKIAGTETSGSKIART
jgi:hypothetical protein